MGLSWFVYILRNVDGSRLYTGITNDMTRRLAAHNAGKGAKATRPGRPWTVAYQEGPMLKGAALRRELEIKRLTREAKDRLISAPQRG